MGRRMLAAALAVAVVAGTAVLVGRATDLTQVGQSETSMHSSAAGITGDASRGANLFGQCGACHPIGRTSVDRDGPNLFGVVGAPVAARRPRFAYTAALRRFGGRWTADRLDAWLAGPAALVPGTTMRFAGVTDQRDRADLIAYLAGQGPAPDRP